MKFHSCWLKPAHPKKKEKKEEITRPDNRAALNSKMVDNYDTMRYEESSSTRIITLIIATKRVFDSDSERRRDGDDELQIDDAYATPTQIWPPLTKEFRKPNHLPRSDRSRPICPRSSQRRQPWPFSQPSLPSTTRSKVSHRALRQHDATRRHLHPHISLRLRE